jgi:hypothetical protein
MTQQNGASNVLTVDQLTNTPSRSDNIDAQTETIVRVFGCELIQDAGIMLKTPQKAIARAQIILHRFYQTSSMKEHDIALVAISTLLLSCKLEECTKPIYDIISAFKKLPTFPTEYAPIHDLTLRTEVIKVERNVLVELGFILHNIELPHTYVFFYLHIIQGNDELAQQAWNFCNDSLRSAVICLTVKPQVTACGAIYMACKKLNKTLPENPPWWLLFETTREELEFVAQEIEKMYLLPKASFQAISDLSKIDHAPPPVEEKKPERKRDERRDERRDDRRRDERREDRYDDRRDDRYRSRSRRSRSRSPDRKYRRHR